MEPREFDPEQEPQQPHVRVRWAEGQPEYQVLPSIRYNGPRGRVVSRWTFTPEERAKIAAGEDLYLEQLTFNQHLQPILPTVGMREVCSQDV
jgi:hypothetical protein